MTGVVTKKVKVKSRLTVPDVVTRSANHGQIALRKMQNATTAKKLAILRRFAFLAAKAVLQKPKKGKGEEQEIGLLRLVLTLGVDACESLQVNKN